MPENDPGMKHYSVTQQVELGRYRAMQQAKSELGPVLGGIALDLHSEFKPGQVFNTGVTRNGVEESMIPAVLEEGNVAITLSTPTDNTEVRLAIFARAEEILEVTPREIMPKPPTAKAAFVPAAVLKPAPAVASTGRSQTHALARPYRGARVAAPAPNKPKKEAKPKQSTQKKVKWG